MVQQAQKSAPPATNGEISTQHGRYLFPTPTAQQQYLRELDPYDCAPARGGRTIEKSPTSSLPMAEEMRLRK